MDSNKSLIQQFYVEEPVGICTDSNFEFGNLYRKTITCKFNKDNECHYNGFCSRQNVEDVDLGWRTN